MCWQHPRLGLLAPGAFLPLAEQAGLMRALSRVVLTASLDQVQAWQRAGRSLRVAVNLSAGEAMDASPVDSLAAMFAERDLSPSCLIVEITEDFLMSDLTGARRVLDDLRRRGVRVAIDDFGTGYSSLSYLRDLPIDQVKLDRSFVVPMAVDQRAGALDAVLDTHRPVRTPDGTRPSWPRQRRGPGRTT